MEEIKEVEKFEDADVFCGDCTGQLIAADVPRSTPQLFRTNFYKKCVLQCNVCSKRTKVFTIKLKAK